jgi:hypothetical protein
MERTLAVINELEAEGLFERYAIGRAVAILFHAEPVLTHDLDVFVDVHGDTGGRPVDLGPIYARLAERGYAPEREAVMIEGIPVQFIPAYNALVEEAVATAPTVPFGSTTTRALGYEHLLALMLQTARPRDRERLALLLDQRAPEPGVLEPILDRHGLTEAWVSWKRTHAQA